MPLSGSLTRSCSRGTLAGSGPRAPSSRRSGRSAGTTSSSPGRCSGAAAAEGAAGRAAAAGAPSRCCAPRSRTPTGTASARRRTASSPGTLEGRTIRGRDAYPSCRSPPSHHITPSLSFSLSWQRTPNIRPLTHIGHILLRRRRLRRLFVSYVPSLCVRPSVYLRQGSHPIIPSPQPPKPLTLMAQGANMSA